MSRSASGTLSKQPWGDARILTKVKVEQSESELRRRREQAAENTPAQLAQMTSVADLPVPTAIQNMFGKKKKEEKKEGDGEEEEGRESRMKVEDMYSNLPRFVAIQVLLLFLLKLMHISPFTVDR